ncbi:Shedu anti-phage system protein SduA domain-containing protein [Streptomyces pseudogriseolus]|uniref:Shedu anti-phage system protein SduA domain-containing protein n=1 Tax=Streptomyces pseudogriseolus TaxID=36817 RepID=UPI003FA2F64C
MTSAAPRWSAVTESLKACCSGPSTTQQLLARRVGLEIQEATPAPVAAAMLRIHLREPLQLAAAKQCSYAQYSYLCDLADLTGTSRPDRALDRELAGGWIQALRAQYVAAHLELWKPEPGDVAVCRSGPEELFGVISSISDTGRLYFRGVGGQGTWPQHLLRLVRTDNQEHAEAVATARQQAAMRHANAHQLGPGALTRLREWQVKDLPGPEAVQALQDALAIATDERPMQVLLEKHREVLAHLVTGHHATFVRPQVDLGGKYVADFAVGGVTSMGMVWRLVELESPTAPLVLKDGQPSKNLRKAIQQIRDWRRWIVEHLGTARESAQQGGTGLEGIQPNPPGLIIIGRENPAAPTEILRLELLQETHVEIRTYDWLVRAAASRPPMRLGALDVELDEALHEAY